MLLLALLFIMLSKKNKEQKKEQRCALYLYALICFGGFTINQTIIQYRDKEIEEQQTKFYELLEKYSKEKEILSE